MKQVTYMGQVFEVPIRFNFIAANDDGKVFVYVNQPSCRIEGERWAAKGEYELVGKLTFHIWEKI